MAKPHAFRVAIHYETDGYRFDNKIMGRQSAGMGFLQALSQSSTVDEFAGWCSSAQSAEAFVADVKQYQANEQVQATVLAKHDTEALGSVSTLYTPGPELSRLAWMRNGIHHRDWSLCGITHTTCSENVIQSIGEMVVAPVHDSDALICTSNVAKQVVESILDNKEAFLSRSIGAKHFVRPLLPVIPLGVDVDAFKDRENNRPQARQRLGIADSDLVVLFAGRLSFHAKANPIPMYLALQQLASQYRIHLVHFGVFANQGLENAFKAAANELCPDIKCHWLDGTDDANKALAWGCADVFCSLVDNIQETFGLTPVEAMAAGLPQVISDWDGYKDTVRHGVDGFRVSTVMPNVDVGADLGYRYHMGIDNFDYYIGHVSQFVGIDVGECVQAFEALFKDPELRFKMGQAGLQRAKEVYDWKVVINDYKSLWYEQARRRETTASRPVYPSLIMQSPYDLYRSFPSKQLSVDSEVILLEPVSKQQLLDRRKLFMVQFSHQVLPDEALCLAILSQLQSTNTQTVWDLSAYNESLFDDVSKAVAWMTKQGWLSIT